MDKIEKALKKLTEKEKSAVKDILTKIQKENTKNLDLKKLKGRDDVFRARIGKIRIIFHKTKESISILSIERKTDRTYKDL
ncbi:MAG: type II toxin-antitoxin system RelE family toxin [Candidatus Paceibacterota bacterium]